MNRLRTLMLLASLTALLLWAGQAPGGWAGLGRALVIATGMNVGAYWFADRIVLRMHHAQELKAFATGRDPQHRVVAVTEGGADFGTG